MEMVGCMRTPAEDTEKFFDITHIRSNMKLKRKLKIGFGILMAVLIAVAFIALISKYYECKHRNNYENKTKSSPKIWEKQWYTIVSYDHQNAWDVHEGHNDSEPRLILSRSNRHLHHQQFRFVKMAEGGQKHFAKYFILNRKKETLISINVATSMVDSMNYDAPTMVNSTNYNATYYEPVDVDRLNVLGGFLWTIEQVKEVRREKCYRIRKADSQKCAGIISKKNEKSKISPIIGVYECADNHNQFWRFEPILSDRLSKHVH